MSGNSALFPRAPYAAVGTINAAIAALAKAFLDRGIARYGEPEEIAELMAFLVSPGARWMTGSSLRMDGGEVKSI
jgi:NAD(P)-dependent dehydrogenase (short-subunit alcohol dehydrogenase family)